MSTRNSAAVAAIAGGAMLALSFSVASAFTLSGPSSKQPVAFAQIEKVWWDRWGRWHRPYYYGHYHYYRHYNYYGYYDYHRPRPYWDYYHPYYRPDSGERDD